MRLVVSKGLEKSGYKYQGSQITRHRRASQQVMDKSDLDLTSQTVSLRYIDSVIHNRQVKLGQVRMKGFYNQVRNKTSQ